MTEITLYMTVEC